MKCPHCGQVVPRAPADLLDLLRTLKLPRREGLALGGLIAVWPRQASVSHMVASIYDDTGEDAEAPERCVYSHVSRLRRKLKAHGWRITNERFVGYRLERIA